MNCPVCEKNLASVKVGKIEIDFCRDGCKGVWFDARELESLDEPQEGEEGVLKEILEVEKVREPVARVIRCPHCQVPLRRHNYSYNTPIIIDECRRCGGIWLDGGELGIIRNNFYHVTDKKAAIKKMLEKERTVEEMKEFHQKEMLHFQKQEEFGDRIMKIISLGLVR
jgi:hypothetical protein